MEDEESKHINKTLNDLSIKMDHKIDELTKSIEKTLGEKQEYAEGKISENPLAYMAGAFIGGLIVGYVMSRGRSCCKQSIIDFLRSFSKSIIQGFISIELYKKMWRVTKYAKFQQQRKQRTEQVSATTVQS